MKSAAAAPLTTAYLSGIMRIGGFWEDIPMVLPISGVRQVGATASGIDKAGNAVQVSLTAYVLDAGDAAIAVSVVETQVLKEAVIPDGAGGFTEPTLVTGESVVQSTVLPVAPLIYRHTVNDQKFPVSEIYDVQIFASMSFGPVSTTIDVYPLNMGLSASIAQAKTDVLNMQILPDPEQPGQLDVPDTVIANSGIPVSAAPMSGPILIASVVIPDWGDQETIVVGGGGLPSAASLVYCVVNSN
jgi:hypothetical protein